MEANCYQAQRRRARMFLVPTVMMVFMAAVHGKMEEVKAGAPEGSLICISKCGTCPATCVPQPQPPPPAAQSKACPPPPSPPANTPPPPSSPKHAPPPPPRQGQQTGLSNPYYYFYTSETTCKHSLSGLSRLFPMILLFSLSMLLP